MQGRRTYVITGGYTAGHIIPGLAIAEKLQREFSDLDVLFMGTTRQMDRDLVRMSRVPFVGIPSAPWMGQNIRGRIRFLLALVPGFFAARRKLRASGAIGLASFGSYAALAPGLAARSLGLPVVVYEPNALPGMANRLLKLFAQNLLVSSLYRLTDAHHVVGVPARDVGGGASRRAPIGGHVHLMILGGSLGDAFLNKHLPDLAMHLANQLPSLQITHQCGHGVDPAPLRDRYARAGIVAKVDAFIDPIAPTLGQANYIISAAGAITLHELAIAGIPTFVVPLAGAAADHQLANAQAFHAATGSPFCTEADWDVEVVASEIKEVFNTPDDWVERSRRLREFATPNAAAKFIEVLGPGLAKQGVLRS